MKHLSGLDATFLYLESAQTPMHVGSLHLYELPEAPKPKGTKSNSSATKHRAMDPASRFCNDVREHIGSRMHLAPIFTNRLVFMPFDLGHPLWQKADSVDLNYHIRPIALPKPGTMAQLEAACAKLYGQLMDRAKPLWEFYVFTGLKDGRVAFFSKVHHAALDGKAGTMLANAMLDLTQEPRKVAPLESVEGGVKKSATKHTMGQLLSATFSNTLAQYAKIVKALPSAATEIAGTIKGARKGMSISLAPKTQFNVNVSAQRIFVTQSISMERAKTLSKALGGTLNDAVLYICSSAVRAYLLEQNALPKKTLIAAMPISVRAKDNADSSNQATMTLVKLGTHLSDPKKRWHSILESTAKVKASMSTLKSLAPTDYPSLLSPWLVGGMARAYNKSKIAGSLPMPANLVISNVPGPQMPLYMARAKMLTFYPLSIIVHGIALNITVQSYAGSIDFGLIACKKAMPDLRKLAKLLSTGIEQLEQMSIN